MAETKKVHVLVFFYIFGLFQSAVGQCTWPSAFLSSTWVDNVHGDLVFDTTTMSGWSFSLTTSGVGQYVNDWQCVLSDQFDSDGYLVMRSVNDFTLFVTSQYYAYVCLKMKRITDVSYRYYVFEPQQPNINSERYLVNQNGGLSTIATTCYESHGASGSEYRVMLKSGSEPQAEVMCPWLFLGRFDYQHTVNGVTTCTAGGNDMDVCSNKQTVGFDFTACSTDVAYSGQTNVTCIDNVPVGTDTFVTVYNSGIYNNINTFLFTCLGVSHDLTSVSVAPGFCTQSQTTNSPPSGGALVTITSITELCRTCAALTSPDGGNVTIQTDGSETIATYMCGEDYDLYGEATRTCQSDETWTGTLPVCKCKYPSSPVNGNVTVSSDGLLATYTCVPGYVLTGSQYRHCQADGNAWNGTSPICDTCDILTNITNGLTELTYEGITTIASFSCNLDYSLSGAYLMACQLDGTWNDTLPTCVACNTLTAPTLGGFNTTTDGSQTTARFFCDTGYQVSGLTFVTCKEDGQWNGTVPTCVCEMVSAPVSGSVSMSTDGLTATYTCDTGYTMSGHPTRQCLLNGSSWTTTPPTCVSCPNLTDPAGGSITYSTDGLQTVAQFTCLSGYTLVGDQTSMCTSDGSWPQTSTTCVACLTLTNPSAGSVSITTNGTVSTATYSCSSGYDLTDEPIRTCQTDGTWTNTAPSCGCMAPSIPENGAINVTGDSALYSCAIGYTLNGDSRRQCVYDGSGWNGSSPTCTVCVSQSAPTGGNYSLGLSSDGVYTYASFLCGVGYTMVGAATLACQSNGTWNDTAPTCTECNVLPSPTSGGVSFTTDGHTTVASFTCDQGTSMTDTAASSSQCQTDGLWTTTIVTCVTCESLASISSGNMSYTTDGSTTSVTYSCVTEYTLDGSPTRVCLNNGSWTGSNPVCVCGSPGAINNGQLSTGSDGMSAVYTCDTGYTLVGTPNLNCHNDGTGWDNTPPTCVKCVDLVGPQNGNVTISTNGTSSVASYLCDTGYTLSGTSTQTCKSDGTWTATAPTCVLCESLTSPSAGSYSLTYNGSQTQAMFVCDSGYYIPGGAPSLLICLSDGTWDSSEPTCTCNVPGVLVNGDVMVSSDGLTANYLCDIKYSLNGTGSRVCNLDGTSWSDSEPVCVSCESLVEIERGNLTYTTDGQMSVVTYGCTVGSTLSGDTVRACVQGIWNGSQPACVECTSLGSLSSGETSLSTDGTTTSAVFTCVNGYYLLGETSTQCLTNGQWAHSLPTCICDGPVTPTNGHLVLSTSNLTATFTCDAGYILTGSSVRDCGTDGSGWSGDQPTCVICETASTPANGTVDVTTDGTVTQAVYNCLPWTSLLGNPHLMCTENGTWNLNPPTCSSCPSLGEVGSGTTTVSTNGTVSVAEFTCSSGYTVVGDTSIQCQTDGTWTGDIPSCVCNAPSSPVGGSSSVSTDGMEVLYSCDVGSTLSGAGTRYCQTDGSGWSDMDPLCVMCPGVTVPNNGAHSLSTNGSFTTATFNCTSGNSLSGSNSITCLSTGFWSDSSPTCVECGGLTTPDSGLLVMDTDGTDTTATFTCLTGYQIEGNAHITCLSNGTWDHGEPSCICMPLSSPNNGNVELSADLATATYTCNTGYTLQGQTSRSCQTGGAGWTDTQPACAQCDSLSNPQGGSVSMTTSGTVTQALYSCVSGYTLDGGATLTCRGDGTWHMSPPSCTSCTTLSTPSSGSVSMTTDGSRTVAQVTCSVGYTLSGNSLLTCKADGSWDFTSPSCVKCQSLLAVSAGTVSQVTDGTTTTAEIMCMTGYYILGQPSITCQSDGTWNENLPACVCDQPSSPVNGSLTVSADGLTVTYTCDIGYSLVGEQLVTCDQNGAGWSSSPPSCIYCQILNAQNNATSSPTSNGTTTIVTYTCGVGSTLTGEATLTCENSGYWTSEEPACAECPSLSMIANGGLTTQTNGTLTVGLFTCSVGYTLSGSNTLTCQSTGTWDSLEPTCVKCENLTAISSGNYSLSTNDLVTTAMFMCVTGYYVEGSSQITCDSDGTWDTSQPNCVCDRPSSPANGAIWVSSDGMTVAYSCDVGYTIQGETGNTCNNDGTGWLYSNPSCNECQLLVPPVNGNLTIHTNGTYTQAVYSCEEGYSLTTNTDISVCMDTGLWNIASPSCVQCEEVTPPSSGSVSMVSTGSSTRVTYSCLSGYDLQGVTQRSCLTNGSWDLSAPTCVCQSPLTPANGGLVVSSDQQTATYSCDVGYSLNGVTPRQCAIDGTGWTGTDPQCATCTTLNSVFGGSVSLTTDGQTTTAAVTCDVGYSISGTNVLTCRSDGTWDVELPVCVICEALNTSSSGSQSVSTDGSISTVTFQCDNGYTLAGTHQATCSASGSWSSTEPDCVECGPLTEPNSGSVNTTSTGTVTQALHTCALGYSGVGETTLTCQTDGTWDGQQPTCVCDPPATPANGNRTVIDEGYTVLFTCQSGYTLKGDNLITCSEAGMGWNGTTPTCVECSNITAPENGSLSTITDGETTQVTIGCEVGYTASSAVNLTCQTDGTFDQNTPQCVQCSSLAVVANGNQHVSSTGSQTEVTFTCDLGYSLQGQATTTCTSDGSWTSSIPYCVQCATLPSVPSSTHSLSTNGSVTTCTVECVQGYTITGSSTLTCSSNGTWDTQPSCLCEAPTAPADGNVISTGQEAVFTCNLGYSLNGSPISYCGTDGTGWNFSAPVCVGCASTLQPSVGEAAVLSDGVSTYILYTCPVGYSLTGNQTITCDQTGAWFAVQPTCTTCENLTSPENGNVSITTDNTTTSATYTCASGYYIEGVTSRYCLDDGTWSDHPPMCYCVAPSSPMNGYVQLSADKFTASYTCDVEYSLDGVSTRVCQNDTTGWSDTQPSCTLCSTLSTPSGGQISASTDGSMTMAMFTCGSGYTLVGSQNLTCRSDGSWNTSEPSCVTCATLTYPSGGTYTISTDGVTSVVQYTCDSGYTLSGADFIDCSTTGQWVLQTPTCESCPTLTAPDSGSMVTVTDGLTTAAIFSCNQGYYISDTANLTCLSSGQWDGSEPECFCIQPTNLTHGNLVVSASQVVYSCNGGYTLNGSISRTCEGNGQGWSGTDPTCVECGPISPPTGGVLVSSTNGSTTTATFTCDTGSTISGEITVLCGADGTWSPSAPSCVECPSISPPSSGNYSLSSNGTHTLVHYTCSVGYSMEGDSSATCQTSATWTSSTPNCVQCVSLSNITNGNFDLSSTGSVTIATFTCVSNYYLKGNNSLECRTDGSWNNTAPSCVCDVPLSVVNGNYTVSTDGMSAQYSCDLGYTMSGSSTRSCELDGSVWSGSPPTCVTCNSLPAVSDGNIVYTTSGTQTTAAVECDVGYGVDTTHYQAVCNSDGTWNSTLSTCSQCPSLFTIQNGNVTLTSNGPVSIGTYYCLHGYTLNGDQTRVCQQGSWNGTEPTCLCSYTTYFENGNAVSDGTTITYSCESGYTLNGTTERTCQSDGTGWSLTQPVCRVCGSLTTPTSGNMSYSTDGEETTAYFTCITGYTLTGSSQLTCRSDGSWNSVEPSCGVPCTALSVPEGGNVTLTTDGQTTTAHYLCAIQHSLVGSSTLTCRSDGSWHLTQSVCVLCQTLTVPDNGFVTTMGDGATSTASYTCHSDYYLDGTNTSTCQSDGTWDSPQPTCYCQAPSAPANGSVSVSSDKGTASFTCREGFSLQGSVTITCRNDSTGWSGNIPECVYCGSIVSVENGSYTVVTDGTVMSVLHTCDTGTTLSGTPNVSCIDTDTWQEQFPTCVSCQPLESLTNGATVFTSDGLQTWAEFTCDQGYSMLGETVIACTTDGSWNASLPTCVQCAVLDTPASGSKAETTDGVTSHVTFACVSGYHIEGHLEVSCLSDGSWNGSAPLCVCDLPSSPTNGQVTTGYNTSLIDYTCDSGYTMDGQVQRQCSDQGNGWMALPPTCVECISIQVTSNLSMAISSNGTVSVVAFECDVGYALDGLSQLQCLDDGTWSESSPSCVQCADVASPDSGSVNVSSNGSVSRAEFTCVSGYHLQGTVILYCTVTGQWDGPSPVCSCDAPSSPVNGGVTSDGVAATYTCDTGYTLYGDNTRSCQQAGRGWNGTQPNCTACSSLDAVAGGSVALATDGTVTTAQYNCNVGYTMFGSSSLTCRSDSTWDYTDTQCVPCGSLLVPDNGNINQTTNGVTTIALFTCDTNHTLKGTSLLTCRTDGTWDFSEPTCIRCADLTDPSSGTVNVTSSGEITRALYSCMPGYYLTGGDSTRMCDTGGIWNGTTPSCVCDSPATPANSTLTLTNGNMTAEFTCELGYTLSGPSTLVCQTDGSIWNGSLPSCNQCESFITVANSSVHLITNGQSSVAMVTCNTGTTLIGQSEIECETDGTWNIVSAPTCVSCPELTGPVGGSVNMSSNGTVSVADYSCDTNYTMSGSPYLQCLETGLWDSVPPICVLCVSVESPGSGSVVFTSDGHTTTVTFSCTNGYQLFGNPLLVCLQNGTWNSTSPYCVCDSPAVPDNGNISLSADRLQTTYSCDVGYSIYGPVQSFCDVIGSGWNTTSPTCVQCSALDEMVNGAVTLLTDQTSTYTSYTCDAGYTLSDDVTRTCLPDGTWTFTDPMCVSCPTLSNPSSVVVSITTDGTVSTASYTCVSGYDLQGTSPRTCQSDGQWNTTQPTCVCQLPLSPDNGNVTFGSNITFAQYTCDVGYTLNGTSQRTCQADGSGWSSISPTCVVCESLESTPGGSLSIDTDGITTHSLYTCDVGYTLVGQSNLTCRNDGTWNVLPPTCVPCATLNVPTGGSVTMSSNNSVTIASFTCLSGYTIQGSAVLSCRSTGTWDLSEPDCVLCPTLGDPAGGNVSMTTDGQTSTALFTCADGYYLDGSAMLTCQTWGVWDVTSPTCKCSPPSPIANGNFTLSENVSVLTHTCNTGYSMEGQSTQNCHTDGQGWIPTTPTCSLCDSLTSELNGSWSVTTDGISTVVAFTCQEGYSLSGGQSIAQCQSDGTWDFIVQPSCEHCTDITGPVNGSMSTMTNGTVTQVFVTCDLGFTLSGVAELICLDNGSWTYPTPTCVTCPTLSSIDNGNVLLSTNGTVSMATYSCSNGYSIIGEGELFCTNLGAWSTTAPVCSCTAFSSPSNGAMLVSENGTAATYTCGEGYTLSGETTLTCESTITSNGANLTSPECTPCETLSTVAGSSIVLLTDGQVTSAVVTCDLGYTVVGSTNLTCRSDGTWNVQTPTCAVCESVATPGAGNVTFNTDGSETIAVFLCYLGYTMIGTNTLTCRSDGTWNFDMPTCIECPSLAAPSSGQISMATDGTVTEATVTCHNGYYIDGNSVLTCGIDGMWSDDIPNCVCIPPSNLSSGNNSLSSDGLTVTYTCNRGYTLSGTSLQTCQSDGSGWSASLPNCSKCSDLQNLTNGIITMTTDGQVTIATYSCSLGYSISGSTELTCNEDGTWDFTEPTCGICNNQSAPTNGNVTYYSTATVTYVQYSCDTGYTLSGNSFASCLADGTWDSTQPNCRECPPLNTTYNGNFEVSSNGSVSIATLSCKAGYSVVGEMTITCTTAEDWSHPTPYCLCEEFSNPLNGDLVTTNNGTTAVYTCGVGYTLTGEPEVQCGTNTGNYTTPICATCESLPSPTGASITMTTDNTTTTAMVTCDTGYTIVGEGSLTCRSDGTWDINTPSCVTCTPLTQPDYSTVAITSHNSVTIATLACDVGYSMSGASSLTCRADGTWDYTIPTCVKCPDITSPAAGNVSMTTDGITTMATYSCFQGYYNNGSQTSVCSTTGTWSAEAPVCICSYPSTPTHGSYSLTDGGFTLTYTCESGYTLNGSLTLTCDTAGHGLSDNPPTCSECETITPSTNSSVTMTTNGTRTAVEFSCATGYSISGSVSLTCDGTGTWSGVEPMCTLCPVPTAPINGTYTLQTNGTTTSVTYQCGQGTSLLGASESECSSQGIWSDGQPTCISCTDLIAPHNGAVQMSSNGSVTLATYYCISGYSVVGTTELSCLTTGHWSHTPPTCFCDDFAQLINGNIQLTDNGTRITYSCVTGYTLNGQQELTCGTASTSYVTPTCSTCDSLTGPTGASITMTTDNTTTTAMVTCDTGYTIVGESVLTCRSDGTWDISTPTCVTCTPLTQPDYSTVAITSHNSVTIATLACDVGYSMSGASSLTCRADGTWDYTIPTCVKCPDITSPAAGNVSMTTDGITTMATYSCFQGYYNNGSQTSVCSTSGTWSDEAVCICSYPSTPAHGSYSLTDGGFTLTYTCESGYTLSGSMTLTCDTAGQGWSDNPPTCSECETITLSTNSTVTMTTNGTRTAVEFSCATGYSISGSVSLTCDGTGTWSGVEPMCTLCPLPTAPINGTYTLQTNGTTTSVTYQCGQGTSLLGASESECSSQGIWSDGQPTCISCTDLTAPHNGAVQMSSNGSVTLATFYCISGYSVVGTTEISCLTTGHWSHTTPTCFCDDFTQLINGNIQLTDNGTRITYSCVIGYTLNGQQELTCGTASTSYVAPTCSTCDSLTGPTGASITMTTDNTTTTAMVTCDTGYTIVGESSLTCRSDGTWDISTPTCVSCQTLNYPAEGSSVNMTSVDSVTVVTVSCLLGYTLNGASTLSCKSDGSWDFLQPSCVQCVGLTEPAAGTVQLTTDGITSSATYSCTHGYYVDGVSMAMCNTSGSWSSVPPVCKCSQPSDLLNGSYVISDEGFTVTYSCDVGFSMSGHEVRTCDTAGTGWSEQPPVCVYCQEVLTDSSVTLTLNGTTSTAEFTCDQGYSIAGSFSLTCTENGTWSGNFPTCQQCSVLSAPENGSLTLQSNGTASTVVFTCTVGSTIVGETEAVCTEAGVWSFEEPLCVSCATLSNPLNGAVTTATDGSVTLATFTCASGYKLVGDDTLMCNSDGTWNNSSPVCVCEIFGEIENGNRTVTVDGTIAVYTCPEGYSLSGEAELTCTVNTSSITLPFCVTCASLQTISGSTVTLTTDGATTIAVVSCDTGYTISGDNALACRTDGTWNITAPSCAVCETLQVTNGINVTLTSNGQHTKALFTCPYGFTLKGTSELECRTDGTWNFEPPHCDCDPPVAVSNGGMVISDDSLTVTYTCDLGYSLTGLTSRSCLTDGSWWSGTSPNCTGCTVLSLTEGLNQTLYTNGTSTTASFLCYHGYTLSHTRNLTCLQDGSWDDSLPTCVTCPSLNMTTGLSYQIQSDGMMSSIAFTCGESYTLTGAQFLVCLNNGTWDSTLPTCTAIPVGVQTQCDNTVNGAAIGLGVAFAITAILAIILAVLAWYYRKLYHKIGGPKASLYKSDQPGDWILQDTERHAPSRAPVSHLHHLMESRGMSRAASQAPIAFSKHNLNTDIGISPSPALMTSRKMGGPKVPRSATSTTFKTESTNLSNYLTSFRHIDSEISNGNSRLSTPNKSLGRDTAPSEHIPDVPTLRLDDSSLFVSRTKHDDAPKKRSQQSELSEQKFKILTPSSIMVPRDIIRGDSPLPQQILTPRNDDDIIKEQNVQSGKRRRQTGKKSGANNIETTLYAERRSGSTLFNDTISSKMKKKSTDFVDTGSKGIDVPNRKTLRTPSPSFKEVDIENNVSDVEV